MEDNKVQGVPDEPLFEEVSALEQAMASEESETEGSFLTGGNTRDFVELEEEKELDEQLVLNPRPVKDGAELMKFLREYLHVFESPYSYIGGEANSPEISRFKTAKVRILIARLSSYESVSLSMSHCLHSDSEILMMDGSLKRVVDLVKEGKDGQEHYVWSLDIFSGERQIKKVLNYFENGQREDLVRLYYKNPGVGGRGLQGDKMVRMTSDHQIWDPGQGKYRLAENFLPGDLVVVEDLTAISQLQEQVIRGSLLGDSSLVLNKGGASVRYGQSEEQREYFFWKRRILCGVTSGYAPTKKISFEKEHKGWQAWTYSTEELREKFYDELYQKGHRNPSRAYLNKLTPLGLAVWYMDDGSLNVTEQGETISRVVRLHVEGFDSETVGVIQGYFEEVWGLHWKFSRRGEKGYGLLYLGVEETEKFLELVESYLAPSMLYKARKTCSKREDWVSMEEGFIPEVVEGPGWVVRQLTRVAPLEGRHATYCVEVEDNHNFFVDGLLTSNSLMAQIYQELPYTFCDLTFLPSKSDYHLLKEKQFPVWFGTNTKLAPHRFDVLSISHCVGMEQLNFVPLLHDSGIPLFKQQRMEREDIPIIIMGGANSGTSAPLAGKFVTKGGQEYSCFVDAVIYGDGEEAAKEFIEVVREGKERGWTKREILRACHGRVQGFYEPDLYEHVYDGKGKIVEIQPKTDYAEFPVKRATVKDLNAVRTLETKILPFTGDGVSVDVSIAGQVGCIGSGGWGACSFCREGAEGPYRERSLPKVLEALHSATVNQGNKEVSFFCFGEKTLFLTGQGLQRIGQKEPGPGIVLDHTGISNYKAWEKRAKQLTKRVKLTDGNYEDLTEDHKVQVLTGEFPYHELRPVLDLKPGDQLFGKLGGWEQFHGTEWSRSISEEQAWLLGLWTGDGSFGHTDWCRIYLNDGEKKSLIPQLEQLAPGKLRNNAAGAYWEFKSSFLHDHGTKDRVSDIVRESNWSRVAAYLQGLFDADGCASTTSRALYVSIKQEDRAREVAFMLRGLGIAVRLDAVDRSKYEIFGEVKDRGLQYEVHIVGSRAKERFATIIGFSIPEKRARLQELYLEARKTESFSFPGEVATKIFRTDAVRIRSLQAYKTKPWLTGNTIKQVSAETVRAVLTQYQEEFSETSSKDIATLFAFMNNDLTLHTVESIEPGPVQNTYDLVDSDNGLVVAGSIIASQSLNFNQYSDLFPLVAESVKLGYRVGLISQRVDMLAETPEQIKVQRWLKKHNYTLGIEGVSARMRAYLNKNLSEWEILKVVTEFMKEGAVELKLFFIACLPAGERVVTERGLVPIQEMGASMTYDGEIQQVVRWIKKPAEPILRVRTKVGLEPRAAEGHLFKMIDGFWKRAVDLVKGDRLLVGLGSIDNPDPDIDWSMPEIRQVFGSCRETNEFRLPAMMGPELAELMGFVTGDGCANDQGITLYANYKDPAEVAYSRTLLDRVGWRTYTREDGSKSATCGALGQQAVAIGICLDLRGTSLTKKVPELIFRSSHSSRAAFLRGLFQADGTQCDGRPRFSTASKQLAKDVQLLLLSLGIMATFHEYQNNVVWNAGKIYLVIVRSKYLTEFKNLMVGCPKATSLRGTGYAQVAKVEFAEVLEVVPDGVEDTYSPDVPSTKTYYASGMVNHNTGLETEIDALECNTLMEKINALRLQLNAKTTFRISFTPLFPSAYTTLQFAPAMAAINHGQRNLDPIFLRARDLGWGRRLSVSGEEPLVSNTVNHGGRNITSLLLASHFQDGFRFYGNIPKGSWLRWKNRIDQDQNINLEVLWGEKEFSYIFPWEDFAYSTSKEVLWRGYTRAVAFQGVSYCLSTRTVRGVCHVNECGACDPLKTGKPDKGIISNIVGRKVAPTISVDKIEEMARSREKVAHLRVLVDVRDPIHRYLNKNYFMYSIPRALMLASDEFHRVFVECKGHARIAPGANTMRDWTYGRNIYDFSLCEHLPESYLRSLIEPANNFFREGVIEGLKVESHLINLRDDIHLALYSMFVPAGNSTTIYYDRLRRDIERYFQRLDMGKGHTVRVRVAAGKGVFKCVDKALGVGQIRQMEYQWMAEYRGTLVRFVTSAILNPLAILETVTGRRLQHFKGFPIRCDAYMQLPTSTNEVDVFAALAGQVSACTTCGGPLEVDVFTGQKHSSGICMSCDLDQYPVDMSQFFTKKMQAVDLGAEGASGSSD